MLTEQRLVQQESCYVLSLANTNNEWYQNRSVTAEKSSSVRYSSLQVGSIPFSMRRSAITSHRVSVEQPGFELTLLPHSCSAIVLCGIPYATGIADQLMHCAFTHL